MAYLLDAGCSRWTSTGRNHTVHIKAVEITEKAGFQPHIASKGFLCGKKYSNGTLGWNVPLDLSKVTCKKCLSEYKNIKGVK